MSKPLDFKDRFSNQSAKYAKFRPHYSAEVFQWLASLPSEHKRVWDCGTGNGQAARGMAEFFDEVIATDPSATQISNAVTHSKIKYRVEPAEKTSVESDSVDLVTAATAAHWFQLEKFYAEVNRVAKKGGWLAIFAYGHDRTVNSEIDPILHQFGYVELGPYWEPELKRIWECYRTIPFPFKEIEVPKFTLQLDLTLEATLGYVSSWSSVQKYIDKHGESPLPRLEERLSKVWGDPAKPHKMVWPIYFRVGQINK